MPETDEPREVTLKMTRPTKEQIMEMVSNFSESKKRKMIENLQETLRKRNSSEHRLVDVYREFDCAHEIVHKVIARHIDIALEANHILDLCMVEDLCHRMITT